MPPLAPRTATLKFLTPDLETVRDTVVNILFKFATVDSFSVPQRDLVAIYLRDEEVYGTMEGLDCTRGDLIKVDPLHLYCFVRRNFLSVFPVGSWKSKVQGLHIQQTTDMRCDRCSLLSLDPNWQLIRIYAIFCCCCSELSGTISYDQQSKICCVIL